MNLKIDNKSAYRYGFIIAIFLLLFPINLSADGLRPFSLRYQYSTEGDMVTIGNTVLVAPQNQNNGCNGYKNGAYINNATLTNDNYFLCSYHADTNVNFPTITAHSKLPNTIKKILWAGLYWQGIVRSSTNLSNMQIKIKHQSENSYHTIGFDQLDTDSYTTNNVNYTPYSAFKNITNLFRNNNWGDGTVYVGDIPTLQGQIPSLGSYGAWSLVVIYEDPNKKLKNFAVFDGYQHIGNFSNGTDSRTITVTGFRTPKDPNEAINSSVSVFVAEGDKNIVQDYLSAKATPQDSFTRLNYFPNQTFGSLIKTTDSFSRTPNPLNNQGIDVQEFDLGHTGYNIIKHNQTSAIFRLSDTKYNNGNGNAMDYYWASMLSFKTDLLAPKICYDYNVKQNNIRVSDDNRTFTTFGNNDFTVNLAIESMEGDFDMQNSTLALELNPHSNTEFQNAYWAPNYINTMLPAVYANNHTSQKPTIAIGDEPTSSGGIIRHHQRYFAKFIYSPNSNHYVGDFDLDINSSIDFGSGPVEYKFSTRNGTLPRCEQTNRYNPIWGTFNVERHESSGDDQHKYPLYTQVVGKDFDFDIVAYKANTTPSYSQELNLDGYSVDLELINANTYEDDNATFICNDPNPEIIQTLTHDGKKHLFAKFENSSRVNMSDYNIQTNMALKNAAFRVWYLLDFNNTIIKHDCQDSANPNECFQNIYNTYYKNNDTALQAGGTHGYCSVETIGGNGCKDYTNQRTGQHGCYACMRDYFARAVCSRDNFAIRPVSYRISISDTNENPSFATNRKLTENNDTNITNLSAGYKYWLDANATGYQDGYSAINGYTRRFDNRDLTNLFSALNFDDNVSCADHNNTYWGVSFINGKLNGTIGSNSGGNLVAHNNAGHYLYKIHDSNWTIVDQARYPYKTFPNIDDCKPDDNSIDTSTVGKSGCDIDSLLTNNTSATQPAPVYYDLNLTYHPYSFAFGNTSFATIPANQNYLFMTDYNDTYYDDITVNHMNMSAVLEGNISALGKQGNTLSNYTKSCAAQDIQINTQVDAIPSDSNITSTFQQYLQYGDTYTNSISDKKFGTDANMTLPKIAFEDNATGTAELHIFSNFKKPSNANNEDPINPIMAHYKHLQANGINDISKAEMSDHTPTGAQPYDNNITFVYGKLTPKRRFYDNVQANFKYTPMFIDIYCKNDLNASYCANFGLHQGSYGENEDSTVWYSAENLFVGNNIGSTTLSTTISPARDTHRHIQANGISPAISIDGVVFSYTAKREDIKVSVDSNTYRPVIVSVSYAPVPWLVYGPAQDFYRVRFIGKSNWAGIGNGGNVANTKSSNEGTTRMNW